MARIKEKLTEEILALRIEIIACFKESFSKLEKPLDELNDSEIEGLLSPIDGMYNSFGKIEYDETSPCGLEFNDKIKKLVNEVSDLVINLDDCDNKKELITAFNKCACEIVEEYNRIQEAKKPKCVDCGMVLNENEILLGICQDCGEKKSSKSVCSCGNKIAITRADERCNEVFFNARSIKCEKCLLTISNDATKKSNKSTMYFCPLDENETYISSISGFIAKLRESNMWNFDVCVICPNENSPVKMAAISITESITLPKKIEGIDNTSKNMHACISYIETAEGLLLDKPNRDKPTLVLMGGAINEKSGYGKRLLSHFDSGKLDLKLINTTTQTDKLKECTFYN